LSANFRLKETSPPTFVGIRKLECFCYLAVRPHDSIFISLDRVPACDRRTDGQTDGQTELLQVIQRSALQAMRPRCKNGEYKKADKQTDRQTERQTDRHKNIQHITH